MAAPSSSSTYYAPNSTNPDNGPSQVLRVAAPAFVECACCYWEFPPENMVACPNGHRFCFKCIRRQIDEIIYGGLKAHGSLFCTAIDNCKESIPLSEIRRAIPNDVIERYEHRQAEQSIVGAKIQDLVYCPFCNVPYEIDKCLQVLDCPNPKCLKASCIQCKKLSHLPLRCEEVEQKSETALRREVEERMAKAVIRECNICGAKLIKTSGCNSVTCKCGNSMCYVYRQTVPHWVGTHFCHCPQYIGERGKPCQICNRCSLTENELEDNEALAAREEALKELVDQKPELLDMKIGPPLKKQGRQIDHQPGNMEIPGRLPQPNFYNEPANRLANPQEFNVLANELANMAVSPAQFLGLNHQLPNMVVPPPQFLGVNHQQPNMAVPPPQFLGLNLQLQNVAVPPPQFLGLNYQLQNMPVRVPHFRGPSHQMRNAGVRPPQFLRINQEVPNTGVRPPQFLGINHQVTYAGVRPPQFWGINQQMQKTGVSRPQFMGHNQQMRPQFLGPNRALQNMAVPPPLPQPEFGRSGNQVENRFGNQEIRPSLQRLRRQPAAGGGGDHLQAQEDYGVENKYHKRNSMF